VAPVSKSNIVKRQQTNPTSLAAVFYRPDFLATSRYQRPTSARLFEILRRYKLWDSATPTQGLPLLTAYIFSKTSGALFSRETRFQKQTTNQAYTLTQIGGISTEANHPHSYSQIFASLPGLNGSANNRHRSSIC
jgi:hypothetical protein